MSATKLQLLRAACEVAGGSAALAERLGISHAMLRKYMASGFELPDGLLLRTVDVILADHEARLGAPPAAVPSPGENLGDH